MHVLAFGLNYRTAPVHIREKFAFSEGEKPKALRILQEMNSILECMILGTCNRTEIFAVVDQLHTGRHAVKCFLSQWFDAPFEEYQSYFSMKENDDAIEYMMRISCGLDSMVLGETQILGQVKDAFRLAQETGTTGVILNTWVKQAITFAKRVYTETGIGENAVSVSYAAIELGKKVFGHFGGKQVLVIGAGQMSELTVKYLCENGTSTIRVVNRTFENAKQLAGKVHGAAFPMEKLQDILLEADIVISSTGSKDYILTKQDVAERMRKRKNSSLFMIDIAVPRDLDPSINELEGVYLYNIDDLEGIVKINLQNRAKEAERIGSMIQQERAAFKTWLGTLEVIPLIAALREKLLTKQAEAIRNIQAKCPDLEEDEIRTIKKQTTLLINQILHDPIVCMKELSGKPGAMATGELFIKMFALEDYVQSVPTTESRLVGIPARQAPTPLQP
jgi:glutamyl-tRNA reductase